MRFCRSGHRISPRTRGPTEPVRNVPRTVELIEMPTGPALLSVLPRLAEALSGAGPALAPVPAGDRDQIARLTAVLRSGDALAAEEDDPDDPTGVVVATSGSTGTPKGTLLSRSALTASAAATQRRLGPPGVWLLTLPAAHIAGLQVLLRSLGTGSVPHVLDTGLPFTPDRFASATRDLPDDPRYLSLVPTQLYRLLGHRGAEDALRSFTAVLLGGAATAAPLLDRARQTGVNVVTTYGMSETCGGCVYDGIPLDAVVADIDVDGRIRLAGPVVARGYRGLPGHPAFKASPDGGRRTFRTDDVGEWVNGRLRILGRVDDVIVTGGLKVAPAALEDAIGGLPTVAHVLVVGVRDAEWGHRVAAVVVPTDNDRPPRLEDLQDACDRAGIRRALHPRSVTLVRSLPLRGPGKPDRIAAAELVDPGPAPDRPGPG